MKKIKILIFLLLISLAGLSETKLERYNRYYAECITIVKHQILRSGYVKFDTIRRTSIPKLPTYYGKIIVSSIKISSTSALIVVADTVWNPLKAPEYADTYLYYQYHKRPIPKPYVAYPKDKKYYYKLTEYQMKKEKPLTYTYWAKINQ